MQLTFQFHHISQVCVSGGESYSPQCMHRFQTVLLTQIRALTLKEIILNSASCLSLSWLL